MVRYPPRRPRGLYTTPSSRVGRNGYRRQTYVVSDRMPTRYGFTTFVRKRGSGRLFKRRG